MENRGIEQKQAEVKSKSKGAGSKTGRSNSGRGGGNVHACLMIAKSCNAVAGGRRR